jgi:hypothetical protein
MRHTHAWRSSSQDKGPTAFRVRPFSQVASSCLQYVYIRMLCGQGSNNKALCQRYLASPSLERRKAIIYQGRGASVDWRTEEEQTPPPLASSIRLFAPFCLPQARGRQVNGERASGVFAVGTAPEIRRISQLEDRLRFNMWFLYSGKIYLRLGGRRLPFLGFRQLRLRCPDCGPQIARQMAVHRNKCVRFCHNESLPRLFFSSWSWRYQGHLGNGHVVSVGRSADWVCLPGGVGNEALLASRE